jgi:hypothetical protein
MEYRVPQCQVCLRAASSRLPLYCPVCARNLVYEPRIHNLQILFEKEALGKQIEEAIIAAREVKDHGISGNDKQTDEAALCAAYEELTSQAATIGHKTQTIVTHLDALQKEMQEMREEIAQRRRAMAQQATALKSTQQRFAELELEIFEPVRRDGVKIESRWNALHNKAATSRIFLCREAASLYGLQQVKRKRGTAGRDTYLIGGVAIPDLRDINSEIYSS